MNLHPIFDALGRALLHFFWQGALLAVLLYLFNSAARRADARLRYAAGCITMLLMLACFVATVAVELPHTPAPVIDNRLTATVPLSPAKQPAHVITAEFLPATTPVSALPDWIACLWLLGVASMSIYTGYGWVRVQGLKRHTLQPLDPACIESLKRRLGITQAVRVCTSILAEAPAVAGWLKPCILLPITALTGLTEPQLHAILAHEPAHIRRHDYLVNLLQTAVETLLFHHPAVWWVSWRIRQEREHCCDDIAVAVCGDAVEYAGALAGMEEIRARVPEPALAATGGDLLGRIRRLLGEPERSSRSLGRVAAAGLALAIAGVPALLSQEVKPTFDVASIKLNTSGDPSYYFRMMGVSPSLTNQTLRNIIMWAYRIHDFQLTGGPAWTGTDRWDIEAKTTAGAGIDRMQLMVQSLLEDRFKVALHREIRELPIFNLTVAKGGLKIQPIKEGACIAHDPGKPAQPPPGKTFMDMCGTSGFGRNMLLASDATMAELATMLANSQAAGRTVVDKTGVSGRFHIQLKYSPEETATSQPGAAPPDEPSIYTALPEQLGLKLDSAKGPVEVLVIDHAEKPSEN